jgi:hypothetical protein
MERAWLELLSRPVAGKAICFLPWSFRFGIHDPPFDYVVALKSGPKAWLLPDGTDRVYLLENGPAGQHLKRIDSSTHSGSNNRMMPFLRHDTLFRFGGYGFWKTRDYFSWFNPSTGRWERWVDDEGLPSALTLYQYDEREDAFYLFGSIENRPHEYFRDITHDSLFRYDFRKRAWQCLGQLDRSKQNVNLANFTVISRICHANFGILRVTGPLAILMDLPAHTMTDISIDRMARIESLSVLHERHERRSSEECYIIMGDSLYTVVHEGKQASTLAIPIHKDMFDVSTSRSFLVDPATLRSPVDGRPTSWWHLLWIPACVILAWYRRDVIEKIWVRIGLSRRKMTAPASHAPDVDDKTEEDMRHFLSTLRPPEQQLVCAIIQRSASGEVFTTADVNRHLGILRNPPEIQKVSRNKSIQSINAAYRTVLHAECDLIERMRDPGDRRLVMYRIQPVLVTSLLGWMKGWEDRGDAVRP